MNTTTPPAETPTPPRPPRKGDGGTYVLIAHTGRDFEMALRYGGHIAASRRAQLLVLGLLTQEDFAGWSGVEAHMRAEAEHSMMGWLTPRLDVCEEKYGLRPHVLLLHGKDPFKLVAEGIKSCENPVGLILGASTGKDGPGFMVDHYSSKGLRELGLPVVLVPDSLTEAFFEKLA